MKKKSNQILLVALLLIALVFAMITIGVAKSTYNKKVAAEKITEPDFYSMQEASAENSSAVLKALKSGSAEKLKKLMIDPDGAENVIGYADWKSADIENAVSLGAGSFSTVPDKKGRIDINERFFVSVGEQKYVIYIETITSRHGMINDGVSAIGATTYEHFNELNYSWNGEKDDNSVTAGKAFVAE